MSGLRIADVIFASGRGGFFYDDQAAIRDGRQHDGFGYSGEPLSPGFNAIRVPAEALSIGLRLAGDTVVWGDMRAVQYAAAGRRCAIACCRELTSHRMLFNVIRDSSITCVSVAGICAAMFTAQLGWSLTNPRKTR